MFVDKQNKELQKLIKQGLNSDTSLGNPLVVSIL